MDGARQTQSRRRSALEICIILALLITFYCGGITPFSVLGSSKDNSLSGNSVLEASQNGNRYQEAALREASPTNGTNRVIVLLARLSDVSNSTSVQTVDSTIFGKMASYYDEVSYHQIRITGNTTDWIAMPNSTVQYGRDTGSGPNSTDDVDGDGYPDSWWLIRDIVSMTENSIDFSGYNTVIVVHSGRDQAESGVPNDIWSAYYSGLDIVTSNGANITCGIILSEDDPMGICAHEFGHSLGLPDLYNVYGGTEFVGKWDLMAFGAWLGSPQGASPAEPTSWCRIHLHWIPEESILLGRMVQGVIDPLEFKGSNFTAIKIPVTTDTYYLIEDRQKIMHDSYLPSSGVLILYCNDALPSGEGIVEVKYSHSLDTATYVAAPGNNMYIDDDRNINITVLSAHSSSYTVSVKLIRPDNTPPTIELQAFSASTWKTSKPATIEATITDTGPNSSSVRNATLFYSSDGGQLWNQIQMMPNSGDTYSAVIPATNSSRVVFYIEAYDYAGNLAIANNGGHYYVYGSSDLGLIIVGMGATFIGLTSAILFVLTVRKGKAKKETRKALDLGN